MSRKETSLYKLYIYRCLFSTHNRSLEAYTSNCAATVVFFIINPYYKFKPKLSFLSEIFWTLLKVEPRFTKSFEMASFLTVRKGGESGYGDWIRLWGVLSRDRITFWKYPEDREDLPAEGYISLRYIVNRNVTTAKRALTSRPNTLELYAKPLKEGRRCSHTVFPCWTNFSVQSVYPKCLDRSLSRGRLKEVIRAPQIRWWVAL